jgi:hypothetical protein
VGYSAAINKPQITKRALILVEGCFLDIKLRIVSKETTNTKTILDPRTTGALPIMKGKGDINLLCGNCGAILVQGIYRGEIRHIFIRCPTCNSYNNVP